MFTVRFPTGFSVQYNSANYLIYKDKVMEIYEKKDGTWIASVPYASGAIIESVSPCRTYNASQEKDVRELCRQVDKLVIRNYNLRRKLKEAAIRPKKARKK